MKQFYDEHISKSLKRYLTKGNARLSDKYIESRIKEICKEKFGNLLNSYTPLIKFFKGRLHISVTSSALKHELTNSRSKMMDLINAELGSDFVKEVHIK